MKESDQISEAQEEASFNPPQFWLDNIGPLYGNKQAIYNKEAYKVVCSAVAQLKQMREKGLLTKASFKQILDYLAQERGRIARETGTKEAEIFGVYREKAKPGEKVLALHTNLNMPRYHGLQNAIKKQLKTNLEKLRITGEKSIQTTVGQSRMTVTINVVDLKEFNRKREKKVPSTNYEEAKDCVAMIELYHNLNMKVAEKNIKMQIGSDTFHLIKCQYEIQINNQWIPTVQYFSFYLSAHGIITNDALKLFDEWSTVICLHMNPLYFDIMHDDMSAIWEKAANWDQRDPQLFKQLQAELHYKQGVTTFFGGGSAAIAEMITKILLMLFDYKLIPVKDNLLDLEILKQPLMSVFQYQFVRNDFWERDPMAEKTPKNNADINPTTVNLLSYKGI